MKLSRREIAVAAAALVRCGGREVNPSPKDFPLGVASADPQPDGALLWTKYEGSETVDVLVWKDGSTTALQQSVVGPYAIADVTGLDAASLYRFAFVTASGLRSSEGRFRTAPSPGTRPVVRLGATSCLKYGNSFAPLGRAGERTDLDAFLMLGDSVYADRARTLDDYRSVWADSLVLPDYQALRASVPLIATWDDHEVANDWQGDASVPADRLVNGKQAFFEHMAVRGPKGRVWRSLRFGDTAEVFVLDSRSEREPYERYLSDAQMTWLKGALVASSARFKVMMTSLPIATHEVPFFEPFKDDRWEGYPTSRTEILQHIEDQQIGGVLWVAGDFHLALRGRVSTSGPGQKAIEILVGPGGQLANVSPSYPAGPQFDWSSGINNYTELELDPARGTIKAGWVDGKGRTFHQAELDVG